MAVPFELRGNVMKSYTILFKLTGAKELPRHARAPFLYRLEGENIEGWQLVLQTTKIGRGERRWDPLSLVGQFLKLTFHITNAGNYKADLWRTSSDEGMDLATLFAERRTRYQVEQERAALESVLQEGDGEQEIKAPQRMRL